MIDPRAIPLLDFLNVGGVRPQMQRPAAFGAQQFAPQPQFGQQLQQYSQPQTGGPALPPSQYGRPPQQSFAPRAPIPGLARPQAPRPPTAPLLGRGPGVTGRY